MWIDRCIEGAEGTFLGSRDSSSLKWLTFPSLSSVRGNSRLDSWLNNTSVPSWIISANVVETIAISSGRINNRECANHAQLDTYVAGGDFQILFLNRQSDHLKRTMPKFSLAWADLVSRAAMYMIDDRRGGFIVASCYMIPRNFI